MEPVYVRNGLEVQVAVKMVKRLNMRIHPESPHVRISIPAWLPMAEVWRMVDENRGWIDDAISRSMHRMSARVANEPALTREEALAFARKVLKRLNYWSEVMGLSYSKLAIRQMKSRWGSCSVSGRICINRRLAHYPDTWLEYVIVHELAHLAHPNHSPHFWALVEKYCPDWRKIRAEMRH